jgi:hypothetical protein
LHPVGAIFVPGGGQRVSNLGTLHRGVPT